MSFGNILDPKSSIPQLLLDLEWGWGGGRNMFVYPTCATYAITPLIDMFDININTV